MKTRIAAGIAALGMIGSLAATGCGLLNDGPTTVSAKYKCTQVVNGSKQQAYCIQDSNSNNYYVPYYIWYRIQTGQDESKYLPSSYTSGSAHEPPDADVPVSYHDGTDDPAFHPVDPVEAPHIAIDVK